MSARVKPYNFIVMIHNYGIKIKGGGGGSYVKAFVLLSVKIIQLTF